MFPGSDLVRPVGQLYIAFITRSVCLILNLKNKTMEATMFRMLKMARMLTIVRMILVWMLSMFNNARGVAALVGSLDSGLERPSVPQGSLAVTPTSITHSICEVGEIRRTKLLGIDRS